MSVQKVRRPLFLMEDSTGPGSSGGGGGVSKFTDLTDGPGDIQAGKTLVGNAEGTALEWVAGGSSVKENTIENIPLNFPNTIFYTRQVHCAWFDNGMLIAIPFTGGGTRNLYCTTDFGLTWNILSELPKSVTTSAGSSSTRPIKMWGDVLLFLYTSFIYMSIDKGVSWIELPRPDTKSCQEVWLNENHMLVQKYSTGSSGVDELWMSSDSGQSFSMINSFTAKGSNCRAGLDGSTVFHLYDGELRLSSDFGQTFRSITSADIPGAVGAINRVAVNNNTIVIGCSVSFDIFISENFGKSWRSIGNNLEDRATINKIVLSESVIVCTSTVNNSKFLTMSFDRGNSWQKYTTSINLGVGISPATQIQDDFYLFENGSVQMLKITAFLSEQAPSDGKLYGAKGTWWTPSTFTNLVDGPEMIKPGAVLKGNTEGTALEWVGGTTKVSSKAPIGTLPSTRRNAIISDSSVIVFPNSSSSSFYISYDTGTSFSTPSPSPITSGLWSVSAVSGDVIIITTTLSASTHRSADGGRSWSWLELQGLTFDSIALNGSFGVAIAGSSTSSTLTLDVLLSSDSGATWTQGPVVTKAAQGQNTSNRLFFGDSVLYFPSGAYYYRSIDNGATWQNFQFPIAIDVTIKIAVSKNAVAAATGKNFYVSRDAGFTWVKRTLPEWIPGFQSLSLRGNSIVANIVGGVAVSLDLADTWMFFPSEIDSTGTFIGWITDTRFMRYSASISQIQIWDAVFYREDNPPKDDQLYGIKNERWIPILPEGPIQPGKVLVGNAEGTGLEWRDISELV